jgi:hypothetical protein
LDKLFAGGTIDLLLSTTSEVSGIQYGFSLNMGTLNGVSPGFSIRKNKNTFGITLLPTKKVDSPLKFRSSLFYYREIHRIDKVHFDVWGLYHFQIDHNSIYYYPQANYELNQVFFHHFGIGAGLGFKPHQLIDFRAQLGYGTKNLGQIVGIVFESSISLTIPGKKSRLSPQNPRP